MKKSCKESTDAVSRRTRSKSTIAESPLVEQTKPPENSKTHSKPKRKSSGVVSESASQVQEEEEEEVPLLPKQRMNRSVSTIPKLRNKKQKISKQPQVEKATKPINEENEEDETSNEEMTEERTAPESEYEDDEENQPSSQESPDSLEKPLAQSPSTTTQEPKEDVLGGRSLDRDGIPLIEPADWHKKPKTWMIKNILPQLQIPQTKNVAETQSLLNNLWQYQTGKTNKLDESIVKYRASVKKQHNKKIREQRQLEEDRVINANIAAAHQADQISQMQKLQDKLKASQEAEASLRRQLQAMSTPTPIQATVPVHVAPKVAQPRQPAPIVNLQPLKQDVKATHSDDLPFTIDRIVLAQPLDVKKLLKYLPNLTNMQINSLNKRVQSIKDGNKQQMAEFIGKILFKVGINIWKKQVQD